MTGFLALLKKLLNESKVMLAMISLALFGLSWISVYRAFIVLGQLNGDNEQRAFRTRAGLTQAGGPSMDFSAGVIEALNLYWFFLMIPIFLIIAWAVSRGSAAIAGEQERGSMDLILSRPVSRTAFFNAHLVLTLLGFGLFLFAILGGNFVGTLFNELEGPPRLWALARPALNLVAVGMAVFGYSVLFSSMDLVRWRPMLAASTITLAQFIIFAIANQPDWDEWRWLNKTTVFGAFYPIEAAARGALLAKHFGILFAVFAVGTLLGFIVFQRRDLPAGGG
jgi:ABC-2 type transport system permease protein